MAMISLHLRSTWRGPILLCTTSLSRE